jgi:hypothetical protein
MEEPGVKAGFPNKGMQGNRTNSHIKKLLLVKCRITTFILENDTLLSSPKET